MKNFQYLYGIHAINSLLNHAPHSIVQLLFDHKRHDTRLSDLLEQAKQYSIEVLAVDKDKLQRMVGAVSHQGLVAKCGLPAAKGEKDLIDILESRSGPALLLILDQVQDPHNLGACLRTADAAGVWAVIAPKDGSVGLTSTVFKIASGAALTVPYIQVVNLARTIRLLRDYGIWMVGTSDQAEQSLYDSKLRGNIALVMGAEGKGLRRLTEQHCDYLVNIPMAGVVESLNVSVATGICLFEVGRQRRVNPS